MKYDITLARIMEKAIDGIIRREDTLKQSAAAVGMFP